MMVESDVFADVMKRERTMRDIPLVLVRDSFRARYRFLETDDEYFNDAGGRTPGQGRRAIWGLYLPDDVLAKIYYGNAEHLSFNRAGRSAWALTKRGEPCRDSGQIRSFR